MRTEIEDLIIRQVALFAGYQNSIKYGVKDLLKELDPAVILKEEQEKRIHLGPIGIPQKYLPFLTYQKVFRYLTDIHHLLSNKEQREIEEKYFHPAFINGYLRSANSDQRKFKNS